MEIWEGASEDEDNNEDQLIHALRVACPQLGLVYIYQGLEMVCWNADLSV